MGSAPSIRLLSVLALALAWSCSATAEIYKWVDEKGVTNYGSAPPGKAKATVLDPQAAKVSVYSPPPQAPRALENAMRDRIGRLESELDAERRARANQYASAQSEAEQRQLAYDQCVRDRRVDCDSSPYYSAAYAPGYGYGGLRRPGFPNHPVARPRPATLPAFALVPTVFTPAPSIFPPTPPQHATHGNEPSRRGR